MKVDVIALYACCDKSYAAERDAWKSFLLLILPLLLEIPKDLIKESFDKALTSDPDECLIYCGNMTTVPRVARSVSAEFAAFLGLSAEFGLACFFEHSPPTKFVSLRAAKVVPGEKQLVGEWLSKFGVLQDDESFLEQVAFWKQAFEKCLFEDDDESKQQKLQVQNKTSESNNYTEDDEVFGLRGTRIKAS